MSSVASSARYPRRFLELVVLFALLASFASSSTTFAAEPVAGGNAALHYWRAFYSMLERQKANSEQAKADDQANAGQQDAKEAAEKIPEDDAILVELHRGAKIDACDWGLDFEDGPAMLMPHCGPARDLAWRAIARANARFASGKMNGGVDDILDAMTLGRHVASDPILISLLVDYAIENMAQAALCTHLNRFDKTSLDRLQAGLGKLPKAKSFRQAIEIGEKKFFVEWFQQKRSPEQVRLALQVSGVNGGQLAALLVPGALKALSLDTAKAYDELAAIVDLPQKEFDQRMEKFNERLKTSAPITKMVIPAIAKARDARDRYDLNNLMLLAAIDVVRDGPEAIKKHRDPYGEGPFEYVELDDGFELRSKRIDPRDQKPQTLRIGPKAPKEE